MLSAQQTKILRWFFFLAFFFLLPLGTSLLCHMQTQYNFLFFFLLSVGIFFFFRISSTSSQTCFAVFDGFVRTETETVIRKWKMWFRSQKLCNFKSNYIRVVCRRRDNRRRSLFRSQTERITNGKKCTHTLLSVHTRTRDAGTRIRYLCLWIVFRYCRALCFFAIRFFFSVVVFVRLSYRQNRSKFDFRHLFRHFD